MRGGVEESEALKEEGKRMNDLDTIESRNGGLYCLLFLPLSSVLCKLIVLSSSNRIRNWKRKKRRRKTAFKKNENAPRHHAA